ncbi:MAG: hypothetical protein OEV44_00900 [Spirochaetota bacterium]|nr:hypothetical protein [Spirochaetota bacterium]
MDIKLKNNIDILLDACTQDDDMFIVFCGEEGAGKSVFMQQVGAYCADYLDTEYNIDNIVFGLNDYLKKSLKSSHYTVINLDEARKILNRSAGATKASRTFTDYASECRSKRQIHIIGLPAYHDLNSYIVNWRMKLLVRVLKGFEVDPKSKSGYSLSRGTFKLYTDRTQINNMYEFKYKYPRQWESFGRFSNYNIIPSKEYDKKKGDNLDLKYNPDLQDIKINKTEKLWRNRTLTLAGYCEQEKEMSHLKIAEILDMKKNTYQRAQLEHGVRKNE